MLPAVDNCHLVRVVAAAATAALATRVYGCCRRVRWMRDRRTRVRQKRRRTGRRGGRGGLAALHRVGVQVHAEHASPRAVGREDLGALPDPLLRHEARPLGLRQRGQARQLGGAAVRLEGKVGRLAHVTHHVPAAATHHSLLQLAQLIGEPHRQQHPHAVEDGRLAHRSERRRRGGCLGGSVGRAARPLCEVGRQRGGRSGLGGSRQDQVLPPELELRRRPASAHRDNVPSRRAVVAGHLATPPVVLGPCDEAFDLHRRSL
mmetsp:Transcript_13411/g.45196  ORF Transcript_13411/g.45196 Transcript_13411/m.45196 type:complete len:261 (-) Transcript_13411:124-906(-)